MILTVLMTLVAGVAPAQDEPVLRVLHAFHEDGQFDGAALVYEDGSQIVRQGFGLANIEEDVPNTPDTRFDIASITKAFTATLVLQLLQDGRWSLGWPFKSLRKNRLAARRSRRGWTRMSMTSPSGSTARLSYCR